MGLRGQGCRRQVTQALSNKKTEPQLTNCRSSGQKPAAIAQPSVLNQGTLQHARSAGRLQPRSLAGGSLCTRVGRVRPKVQQRGSIPKDKVNSPHFLSKLCLHMCRSPSRCWRGRDACRSCRPQASSWQACCSLQPCIDVWMLLPWCPHWLSLKNSKKPENRFSLFSSICFLGT